MAVLLKNNALFLHVPKTGGSWIIKVLDELGLVKAHLGHEHSSMEHVLYYPRYFPANHVKGTIKFKNNFYEEILNSYKFCFVRDPMDWYESYWRFQMGHNWKIWRITPKKIFLKPAKVWHPWNVLEDCSDDNFNEFLLKVAKNSPGYVSKMYSWYATEDINFVGKQENLAEDLIEVLKRMDFKFNPDKVRNFQKINESKVNIKKPIWDENLRELFLKLEYSSMYRFNYLDK